jgi:hypothetical protein
MFSIANLLGLDYLQWTDTLTISLVAIRLYGLNWSNYEHLDVAQGIAGYPACQ